MCKLTSSAKDSDDLSIGFDRNRRSKRNKLTDKKNIKGRYHVRNMLKGIFSFSKSQKKSPLWAWL